MSSFMMRKEDGSVDMGNRQGNAEKKPPPKKQVGLTYDRHKEQQRRLVQSPSSK